MENVADAGYQGFEFGDWRAQDPAAITRLKRQLKLECVCIVGNISVNPKGMGLCDPAEREGFLAEVRASADAARRFETKRLVVLTGNKVSTLSREQQHASVVEGLKRAHDIVAPHGITLILEVINTLAPVEPLNPKTNHLDYYLNRTPEAFSIVREVAARFVKVLFDLYHVQIMEGNLIETLRANIARHRSLSCRRCAWPARARHWRDSSWQRFQGHPRDRLPGFCGDGVRSVERRHDDPCGSPSAGG